MNNIFHHNFRTLSPENPCSISGEIAVFLSVSIAHPFLTR